jgi:hypothetical protein
VEDLNKTIRIITLAQLFIENIFWRKILSDKWIKFFRIYLIRKIILNNLSIQIKRRECQAAKRVVQIDEK